MNKLQGLRRKKVLIATICILVVASLTLVKVNMKDCKLKFDSICLHADVADSAEEQLQGLSGRSSLGKNEAMLFTFAKNDYHGIWMKDMNFSIDIVWLDEQKKIIHMVHEISPTTYPEQVFRPQKLAKYVIELPSGWLASHNASSSSVVSIK